MKGLVVLDKISNNDGGIDLIPMLSRVEMICKQEGVLFSNRWRNEACRRILITRSLIFQILEGIHDGCVHQGVERVIHIVNLEMNWEGKDIRDYIRVLYITKVRV